jgi:CubicO group peptidase (beta-lactamase class C family)
MSDEGRSRVLEVQADGPDLVLDIPLRLGHGLPPRRRERPGRTGHRVAWWPGNGGSMSFVDPDTRLSVVYVHTWVTGGQEMERNLHLPNEVYLALSTA